MEQLEEAAELMDERRGLPSHLRPVKSQLAEAKSLLRRYTVAVLCVLIAFAIRYWLSPVLGEELPFMLFVAASLVAAWYGGAVTGITALLLGLMLASYFFLPAKQIPGTPYSAESVQLIRYFFTASLGIALIEVLHRDRRRTRAAVDELQREIQRRQRTELALREAQGQLQQYAEKLEQRVSDRTARLSETIESLRDLLYHIAHNLRAPLRALEGYSTLLASECKTRLEPASQEHLRHIADAAKRMDHLIHDLLTYGRLGQMEVNLTEVDLQRSVGQVLLQMDNEIQSREARIEVLGPLPKVKANVELMDQILTNLLDNACQFMGPGVKPHVRIWAERRSPAVRLWIEDNGIGIDPKYHERIFGVFETLHPGHGNGGTGMGLALVKQAMQRLEGRVGVESQLDAGSRFWLEFQALN